MTKSVLVIRVSSKLPTSWFVRGSWRFHRDNHFYLHVPLLNVADVKKARVFVRKMPRNKDYFFVTWTASQLLSIDSHLYWLKFPPHLRKQTELELDRLKTEMTALAIPD